MCMCATRRRLQKKTRGEREMEVTCDVTSARREKDELRRTRESER